jgi:cell division protein FtsI (penicillin-binding protein 3)
MRSSYDASHPIHVGGFTIEDFHGKKRRLTVPEIFIYSSNIGAAKMALALGVNRHRAFLDKLGLLSRSTTEIGESAAPIIPSPWQQINTITIAYGHGLSVTPLQLATATLPLVNGGFAVTPTFLPRSRLAGLRQAPSVVKPATSQAMLQLMRLNVLKGTGKRAEAEGYRVGGKTGTAEKVVDGHYSNDKRFNAFVAAFPMDDPQYIVLSIIDEPKPEKPGMGATAGSNAAPIAANIIRRSASMLGVKPDFGHENEATLVSYQ